MYYFVHNLFVCVSWKDSKNKMATYHVFVLLIAIHSHYSTLYLVCPSFSKFNSIGMHLLHRERLFFFFALKTFFYPIGYRELDRV